MKGLPRKVPPLDPVDIDLNKLKGEMGLTKMNRPRKLPPDSLK